MTIALEEIRLRVNDELLIIEVTGEYTRRARIEQTGDSSDFECVIGWQANVARWMLPDAPMAGIMKLADEINKRNI